jgi:hypothetical protein
MKLATLFAIYAGIALVFCVGLLAVPGFWITLYGASAEPQAVVLLRLVGALYGGVAVMCWVGRASGPSPARRALVLGLAVANVLAALASVGAALSGVYNQLAWGPVGVFTLAGLSFALIGRPAGSASRAS